MVQFGTSISEVFEQTFNKVLPIPKQPKAYRPRMPSRANSWIPAGRLGDLEYERRLEEFAEEIKAMNITVRPSARGWGYILEGEGKVTKGQFGQVGKAIGDCIKAGYLSLDIIAEDQDETRRFEEIEKAGDALEALKELEEKVENFEDDLNYYTTDFLNGEKYFVVMIVEKGDIRNLFEPICKKYHVPIASSKGWASNRNKFSVIRLAREAKEKKMLPVLLMFYDLDSWGLKISETTKEKLVECSRGAGRIPDDMIFERFGLNREDVEKYNLTYITDPRNEEQKVESNALFRNSKTLKAGKEMCRKAIEKYLGADAIERFRKKEKKGVKLNQEQLEILQNMQEELEQIKGLFPERHEKKEEAVKEKGRKKNQEKIVSPKVGYWPSCPNCHFSFNVDDNEDGKLFICKHCGQYMRLKLPIGW